MTGDTSGHSYPPQSPYGTFYRGVTSTTDGMKEYAPGDQRKIKGPVARTTMTSHSDQQKRGSNNNLSSPITMAALFPTKILFGPANHKMTCEFDGRNQHHCLLPGPWDPGEKMAWSWVVVSLFQGLMEGRSGDGLAVCLWVSRRRRMREWFDAA
ncbi:hypothetical protein P280DRAFT_220145 [Massarina eburnea CBS 473.64]|uniref:Uncharacterized protein n=1 Tax=Massarina eburnea CBS 473.64 TaxID=1395130 RepID=A0A6A6SAN9_9PLEO|nr:hypothetical protein P280DRAFT_220145 [Massarina eburnea CBS 473.64]